MAGAVRIVVARKPRIVKRWKAVVGPVRPLGEGVHVALHYVYIEEGKWRVEPHVAIDSSGTLSLRGVYVLEGQLALARYEGLREAMAEGVSRGLFPTFHLAPWGAPVLFIDRVSRPDEEALEVLDRLGAWRALKWLEGLEVEVTFE